MMRLDVADDEYFDVPFAARVPAVDLTAAQSLTWRAKSLRTGELILTLTIGSGLTIVDATNALLVLTQAQTALFTDPAAYELELVEASGQKSTADKGVVVASPDL